MVGTCHVLVHLAKLVVCGTAGVNPNINYEICVLMMCQCRLINCKKYITLVWIVDSGGDCVCLGEGII